MRKKLKILSLFLLLILLTLGVTSVFKKIREGANNMLEIDGGVIKNHKLPGYEDKIKSKDIVTFEYTGDYYVLCEKKNNKLHIVSKGGDVSKRDGTAFKLDYETDNLSFLKTLQKIVEDYEISKNNGYEYEVSGLPSGLGDTIKVVYENKEKIWKYNNQQKTISNKAIDTIYEVFKNEAVKNNYDFTTDKSNQVYDDATTDYVQGTWIGEHFGTNYKVVFSSNNIKIYENGKLTDDVTYRIIDGSIVVDKLKKGITEGTSKNDYEEFSTISIMKKKNSFTLTAYFMKESYSTCDLLKQKED